MDKEYWTIQYREPIAGKRTCQEKVYEQTLQDALDSFLEGPVANVWGDAIYPLRATYCYGVNGRSYIYTVQSSQDTPARDY